MTYEVYALKYAHHARCAAENFIGGGYRKLRALADSDKHIISATIRWCSSAILPRACTIAVRLD